jgi:stage V sporulation protein R
VLRTLLKQQLTLHWAPVIYVKGGNCNDNRELYLVHVRRPNGHQELDGEYSRATLEKIFRLWGRPVHLETDELVLSYQGEPAKVG